MFRNEMTRKMPCWGCKGYPECIILKGFLKVISKSGGFPKETEDNISLLTFQCDKKEDE